MLRSILAALSLFAVADPALAQRFHLQPVGVKVPAGAQLDTLDGVLLKDDKGVLTIRVEGGTVEIDKRCVAKTEQIDLTVGKIEDLEKANHAKLVEANHKRMEVQAAEAAMRQREDAKVAETAQAQEKTLTIYVDFQGLLPNYVFQTYDPVLHRANLGGLRYVIENFLREEVERSAGRR